MSPTEEGRLDSWKEIAEYLGRDMHTCLRWEKEKGLPVHTIPGGKRRTVYSYKQEIDDWLANSPVKDEPQAQPPAPASRFRSVWQRLPILARAGLGIALLGLAGFGAYVVRESRSPALTQLLQEGNRLVAISPNSSVAWSYDFSGDTDSAYIKESRVLPERKGRGEAGVLVSVDLGEGKGNMLYFFSPRGEPLWQFQPADTVVFGTGNYTMATGFLLLGTLQSKGQTKVLLATRDWTWWPSQLLALNLHGQVEARFVNSGWIHSAYSMEGPLGSVVVVGGASNSYDGAFLAVLDANHLSGSSPEQPGSQFECKNCPAGRPVKYFIFPRSELNVVTGSLLYPANGNPQGDSIPVVKWEVAGDLGQGYPESIYEFFLDFQLKGARYGDRYWAWHRRLEKEGKIKHSRESCPERDGPPLVRMWDAEHGWQELHPNAENGRKK